MADTASNKIFYGKEKVQIKLAPQKDESISVFTRPGDKVSFDFDVSKAAFKLVGGDIVVKMPDGGEIVFVSMAQLAFEENPPQIILSNGQPLEIEGILMQVDDVKESPVESMLTDESISLAEELAALDKQIEEKKASLQEKAQALEERAKDLEDKAKEQEAQQQDQKDMAEKLQKTQVQLEEAQQSQSQEQEQLENQKKMIQIEDVDINPDVAEENDYNAYFKPTEDSSSSSNNTSLADVTATLDFDIGFFQTQKEVSEEADVVSVVGGGGSVRARYDGSGEAQMEAEVFDYSSSDKKMDIIVDNPKYFDENYISKLIALSVNQPEGFRVESIKISGLADDFEIVGGVKNGDSWLINRGSDDTNGFKNNGNEIELVLKYKSQTTNNDLSLNFELHSIFNEANIEIDPLNPKEIVTPENIELLGLKEVGIQVKDIESSDDYIYNGSKEVGFVLAREANENIILTSQNDTKVIGGLVNDNITAFGGNDIINAMSGDDKIIAGEGDDIIDGGDGIDLLDYQNAKNSVSVDLKKGVATGEGSDKISNIENLIGSLHDDTLIGEDGTNIIEGKAGHDNIKGEGGDDTLIGGEDNDKLSGGAGNDILIGGSGSDSADFSDSSNSITAHIQAVDLKESDEKYGTALGEGEDRLEGIENLIGSNQGDSLFGDDGINELIGNGGNDYFVGGKGNDNIDGGDGVDAIDYSHVVESGLNVDLSQNFASGEGFDSVKNIEKIIATSQDDKLVGDDGNNIFIADKGNDYLDGKAGDDDLNAGAGDDTLKGGAGNDTLDGGEDGLYGDWVDYSSFGVEEKKEEDSKSKSDNEEEVKEDTPLVYEPKDGIDINLSSGIASGDGEDKIIDIEHVQGSKFDDVIIGNEKINTLKGYDGYDTLMGGAGDDLLDGGSGLDTVDFSSFNESVEIDLKAKSAIGDGIDTLISIENAEGSSVDDKITGDANNNILSGNAGDDEIFGLSGHDTLLGGGGDDVLDGGSGDDIIDGGENGSEGDEVDYSSASMGVKVDLSIHEIQNSVGAGNDTIINIENLRGSNLDDTLLGNNQNNKLYGGSGKDILVSKDGDDYLYGERGDDTLVGGDGDDFIDGGDGADLLDNSSLDSSVYVDLSKNIATGIGNDTITNIENVSGSSVDDILIGDDKDNFLMGNSGNDTLIGNGGNDHLDGGDGEDSVNYEDAIGSIDASLEIGVVSGEGLDSLIDIENIYGSSFDDLIEGDLGANKLFGNSGLDEIHGRDGSDNISGGKGNDNLFGDDGDDLLKGDEGDDTLSGGGGNDTLDGGEGLDVVDYSLASESINLDLSSKGDKDIGGGQGIDSFVSIEGVIGTSFDDTLKGDNQDNILLGRDGNDYLDGGGGNDLLDGGEGSDSADYSSSLSSVIVDLNLEDKQDTLGAGMDTLKNIENLSGSNHDDILIGNKSVNVINGLKGNDKLSGGLGNDILIGGEGIDSVDYQRASGKVDIDLELKVAKNDGFGSSDTLEGIENVIGSQNSDKIFGDINNNILDGGSGNDLIFGANGDDTLIGGDGDDTFIGEAGDDIIDGGSGEDSVDYKSLTKSVDVNLDQAQATNSEIGVDHLVSIERVVATNQDDTLIGNNSDNILIGNGGEDFINGLGGDDSIFGGIGNDQLDGGDGDDFISGGDGDDTLKGGLGNDVFSGGNGIDSVDFSSLTNMINVDLSLGIVAGEGSDTISGVENIIGSNQNDRLVGDSFVNNIYGNDGSDFIDAKGGDDTLYGGEGNDILRGGEGDDFLKGGAGLDIADYGDASSGVEINLSLGASQDTKGAGVDQFESIENISGSLFDDILTGDSSTNTIIGNLGNDTLFGLDGDDTLMGESGDDTLMGGVGNDRLIGGSGSDSVDYSASSALNLSLRDESAVSLSDGIDTLESIENIIASSYDDTIEGNSSNNILVGGDGEDLLTFENAMGSVHVDLGVTEEQDTSSDGKDKIIGFENLEGSIYSDILIGDDSINKIDANLGDDTIKGGGGDDILDGNIGSDLIFGEIGNDTIDGGVGNDIIDGGIGDDTLDGGLNDDTFIASEGKDIIDGGSGEDSVDYTLSKAVNVTLDGANSATVSIDMINDDSIKNIENIIGSSFDDYIMGDSFDNKLIGNSGDDTLDGYTGADRLEGGSGDDTIKGGVGDDSLYGNSGNDILSGGEGDDFIDGGLGEDSISFLSSSSDIKVTLRETNAQNTGDSTGIDTIYNIENVIGSAHNDTIEGDSGDNILDGGLGIDTLSFKSALSGVNIDLGITTKQNTIGDGEDTFIGFENLIGSLKEDTLKGDSENNVIHGESADDIIYTSDGNDRLFGDSGNDQFIAGLSDGTDTLDGGSGSGDEVDYSNLNNKIEVTLNSDSEVVVAIDGGDNDSIKNIENISGSSVGDNLTGDLNSNHLKGNDGDDTLNGEAGDDLLEGGDGNDTIIAGGGNDIVDGGAGDHDRLDFSNSGGGVNVDLTITDRQTISLLDGDDTIRAIEDIVGSSLSDTLVGDNGVNTLFGGHDNDILDGGDGDDQLFGGGEDDTFVSKKALDGVDVYDGGDGSDSVDYSSLNEQIDVTLNGVDDGSVSISGGNSDILKNIENIIGSRADNYIAGDANKNILTGNIGRDTLEGGDGDDTLIGKSNEDVLLGGDGDDRLEGGNDNDRLVGGANDDSLYGDGGDDTLIGGSGDDYIEGGTHDGEGDTLSYENALSFVKVNLKNSNPQYTGASTNTDTIRGIENILGSNYDDTIEGDGGNNLLDGGDGVDTISFENVNNGVDIDLKIDIAQDTKEGEDTVVNFENIIGSQYGDHLYGDDDINIIDAKDGSDTIIGAKGDDDLRGGFGNDIFIAETGDGDDHMDGGSGSSDEVNYQALSSSIEVSLDGENDTTVIVNSIAEDTIKNIENVTGSSANDTIIGDQKNNILKGDSGEDILKGGFGNDTLKGGSDDDTLSGDGGNDILDGEDGIDTVDYSSSVNSVSVDLSNNASQFIGLSENSDTLINIENIVGSNSDDTLFGNSTANEIHGSFGDDTLDGSGGVDQLFGDGGDDTFTIALALDGSDNIDGGDDKDTIDYSTISQSINITLDGSNSSIVNITDGDNDSVKNIENVIGSSANDTIRGDGLDNVLNGSSGNDTLEGGFGNDTIIGGDGEDTLSFENANVGIEVNLKETTQDTNVGIDKISDFENVVGSSNNDTIEGDSGNNKLDGGVSGNDTVSFFGSVGSVIANLFTKKASGDGDDDITNFDNIKGSTYSDNLTGDENINIIDGDIGNDIIDGGLGADNLKGGEGADTFIGSSFAGDTIDGGDGSSDKVDYSALSNGVNLNLDGSTSVNVVSTDNDHTLKNVENIIGTNQNDFLSGDDKNNEFFGAGGSDELWGELGNDTLHGGDDGDTLYGGSGFDKLYGDGAIDTIYGGESNDNIYGGDGDDILSGDSGDDIIEGNSGDDTLSGGVGDDIFYGGDATTDSDINGDSVDYSGALKSVSVNLADGDAEGSGYSDDQGSDKIYGIEHVIGSNSEDDIIRGNNESNILDGRGGNDEIFGEIGTDTLKGGNGDDTLHGGDDSDTIDGESGDDTIYGDDGDDTLKGGIGDDKFIVTSINDGTDTIDGGADIDEVDYSLLDKSVQVSLDRDILSNVIIDGSVQDTIVNIENITGGTSNDTLEGDSVDNTLIGNSGDDTIEGGLGNDYLRGGEGEDTISFEHAVSNIDVNLKTTTAQTTGEGSDTIIGFENILGSNHDDTIEGDGGDNILDGGSGNDTVSYANAGAVTVDLSSASATGDGTDTLANFSNIIGSNDADILIGDNLSNKIEGGQGNDEISGGDGADTLHGNSGNDIFIQADSHAGDSIDGGSENDTIDYSATTTNGINIDLDGSIVSTVTIGADTHTVVNIENVIGSAQNDNILGDLNDNSLVGNEGDDTIGGESGDDDIFGGVGEDILSGGSGKDSIHGGGDADILYGNDDDDELFGDDGNDRLEGGAGTDILTGGSGDDILIGGADNDKIYGGEGADTVDYSGETGGVTVSLTKGATQGFAQGGNVGYDNLFEIENIIGGSGGDLITGNDDVNILDGGAGDDTIIGGKGNDTIRGGAGSSDTLDYSKESLTGATGISVDLNNKTTAQTIHVDYGDDLISGIENIIGSDKTDTLIGDEKNNILKGGADKDNISGGAGNDTLYGGTGDDTFIGGSGNDTIYGEAGSGDEVDYSYESNSIDANLESGEVKIAGALEDTISGIENYKGSTGNDIVIGNSETNKIKTGAGADTLKGSLGADTLDGGDDSDTVDYTTYGYGVSIDLDSDDNAVNGNSGTAQDTQATIDQLLNIENIIGSNYNDTLEGGEDSNTINGGAGQDTLIGRDGADRLIGGVESDTIDFSDGGEGVDVDLSKIQIDGDNTTYRVQNDGFGNKEFVDSVENIIGTAQIDTIIGDEYNNKIEGGDSNDTLIGHGGNDILEGGDGDDLLSGGADNDIINGGEGTNTLDYTNSLSAINADLSGGDVGSGTVIGEGTDTVSKIQNILGSSQEDTIIGDAGVNILKGGSSSDTIRGGAEADKLMGESGDDYLQGGLDGDLLYGEDNIASPDGGSDWADYSYITDTTAINADLSQSKIEDASDATNVDTTVGIENIRGTKNSDTLKGDDNTNTLLGGDGDDTLFGSKGSDRFDGEGHTSYDTLDYSNVDFGDGGHGVNVNLGSTTASDDGYGTIDTILNIEKVIGTQGADILFGSTANDIFLGGDGADVIEGLAGNDTLSGNAGADIIKTGSGDDTVHGGADEDTIYGESGANELFGDEGADIIYTGIDNDKVTGGDGVDTLNYATIDAEKNISVVLSDSTGIVTVKSTTDGSSQWSDTLLDHIEIIKGSGSSDSFIAYNDADNANEYGDTFYGLGGNDLLKGGIGDDALFGGDNDDTIYGQAGNDEIDGGNGVDTLSFEDITSAQGVEVDLGNGANEVLEDGFGSQDNVSSIEIVQGSKNADTIKGNTTIDTIYGNGGDDTIIASGGGDSVVGGEDSETIGDTLSFQGSGSTIVQLNYGATGIVSMSEIENILGSTSNDDIRGDIENNILDGSSGNDIIYGIGGNNKLIGGEGDDYLRGGYGIDSYDGGDGSDTISFYNTSQNVKVDLAYDNGDTTYGRVINDGYGNTEIIVNNIENISGSQSSDILQGNDGINIINGNEENDIIVGRDGDDVFNGGDGSDIFYGGKGSDTINGGAWTDAISFDSAYGDVFEQTISVDLSQGKVLNDGYGFEDTISSIEKVIGSSGDDILIGYAWTDYLNGEGGDDMIYLSSGGSDRLDGGDNTIEGDTLNLEYAYYNSLIDLSNGNMGGGVIATNFENVMGKKTSGRDESVRGTSGINKFYMYDGADIVEALDGDDIIDLGAGDDKVYGSAGNDIIIGGTGTDWLDFSEYEDGKVVGNSGISFIINDLDGSSYSGATSSSTVDGVTQTYYEISDGYGYTDYIAKNSGDTNIQIENIETGNQADIISMDDQANHIITHAGNDTIYSHAGNDIIESGQDDDTIYAGAGDDKVKGGNANDIIYGGDGVDILYGNLNDDEIHGGTENDKLYGGDDQDTLYGEEGDDTLDGGSGDDTIYDEAGTDTIDGGTHSLIGGDTLIFADNGNGITIDLVNNTATDSYSNAETVTGIEHVTGTAQTDIFIGNSENNIFKGNGGDDVFNLSTGSDEVFGGTGDHDKIVLTDVATTVDLSQTQNNLNVGGDIQSITEVEDIDGGAGADNIIGSNDANIIKGGAENDTIEGLEGDDNLQGGTGTDTISFIHSTSSIDINIDTIDHDTITANSATGLNIGTDTLSDFDNVIGSNSGDTIYGNTNVNTIDAKDGDDIIDGLDGNDILNGNGGDDTFISGLGDDVIDGGDDSDTVDYSGVDSSLNVTLSDNGTQTSVFIDGADTLTNIENLIGSKTQTNEIIGNNLSNTLTGGDLNDILKTGSAGENRLNGGAGEDTIFGDGSGDDYLDGGVNTSTDTLSYENVSADMIVDLKNTQAIGLGTDTIHNFRDVITGSGIDLIKGNIQDNILDGGAGNSDTISFEDANAVNVTIATQGSASSTGQGSDTLNNFESYIGSNSTDTFVANVTGSSIDGGGSSDILDYNGEVDTLTLDIDTKTVNDGISTDTFENIEEIRLSDQDDMITVADSAKYDVMGIIDGKGGNDTLHSSATNLTLNANTKNIENVVLDGSSDINIDVSAIAGLTISGNSGNNIITIGHESDIIDGDGGSNTLKLNKDDLNLGNINYSNIEIIDTNGNNATTTNAKLNGLTLAFKGAGKVEFNAGTAGNNNYANIASTLTAGLIMIVASSLVLDANDDLGGVDKIYVTADNFTLNAEQLSDQIINISAGKELVINQADGTDLSNIAFTGDGTVTINIVDGSNIDVSGIDVSNFSGDIIIDDGSAITSIFGTNYNDTIKISSKPTSINGLDANGDKLEIDSTMDLSDIVIDNIEELKIISGTVTLKDTQTISKTITGDGAITVLVTTDNVNLSNIQTLGTNRAIFNTEVDMRSGDFGDKINDIEVKDGAKLTVTDTKISNGNISKNVIGDGEIVVQINADSDVDFSNINTSLTNSIEFRGNSIFNGDFANADNIEVFSGNRLTLSDDKLGSHDINGAGSVTVLVDTSLDNSYNFSNLLLNGVNTKNHIEFTATNTFEGSLEKFSSVDISNGELSVSDTIISGKNVSGAGKIKVIIDSDSDIDLSSITVGSSDESVVFTGNSLFSGDFSNTGTISVDAGVKLVADASIVSGKTITNNGSIDVTNLNSTSDANLSNISGTLHAFSDGDVIFNGDLGNSDLTISSGTMTINDSILGVRNVDGGGNIVVNADDSNADLSNITTTGLITINSSSNSNTITGSNQDDVINIESSNLTSADTIDANGGTDTLNITTAGTADATNVTVESMNLADGTNDLTLGTNVDTVYGGTGDDTFTLDFSNVTTIDANTGSDIVKLTGTKTADDTNFDGASNISNIDILDIRNLTIDGADDQELIITKEMIQQWSDGDDDITLKLTADQAENIQVTADDQNDSPDAGTTTFTLLEDTHVYDFGDGVTLSADIG